MVRPAARPAIVKDKKVLDDIRSKLGKGSQLIKALRLPVYRLDAKVFLEKRGTVAEAVEPESRMRSKPKVDHQSFDPWSLDLPRSSDTSDSRFTVRDSEFTYNCGNCGGSGVGQSKCHAPGCFSGKVSVKKSRLVNQVCLCGKNPDCRYCGGMGQYQNEESYYEKEFCGTCQGSANVNHACRPCRGKGVFAKILTVKVAHDELVVPRVARWINDSYDTLGLAKSAPDQSFQKIKEKDVPWGLSYLSQSKYEFRGKSEERMTSYQDVFSKSECIFALYSFEDREYVDIFDDKSPKAMNPEASPRALKTAENALSTASLAGREELMELVLTTESMIRENLFQKGAEKLKECLKAGASRAVAKYISDKRVKGLQLEKLKLVTKEINGEGGSREAGSFWLKAKIFFLACSVASLVMGATGVVNKNVSFYAVIPLILAAIAAFLLQNRENSLAVSFKAETEEKRWDKILLQLEKIDSGEPWISEIRKETSDSAKHVAHKIMEDAEKESLELVGSFAAAEASIQNG